MNILNNVIAIIIGLILGASYLGSFMYQQRLRSAHIAFGALSSARFLIIAAIFAYILRSEQLPFILVVSTFIITIWVLLWITKAHSYGSRRQP